MLDHSFTLQAVMEVQKLIAEVGIKTDRLIKDVETHGGKIDLVEAGGTRRSAADDKCR